MKVTRNYNNLLDDYNQLIKENEILSQQNNELIEDLDELKRDYSAFKSRYEDIYSRDIIEIFNLDDLWREIFKQDLENPEKIVIATDKFKPDNIIVGQDYVCAESKDKAVEWLKIVKTALIFVESNDDFNNDLNNVKEDIPEVKQDYEIPNNFENFWD